MRRYATTAAAGMLGLIATAESRSAAQDGPGLLIRPPAEVRAEDVHPAPPAPTPPDAAPPPPTVPAPDSGPALAIIPSIDAPGRPTRLASGPIGLEGPAAVGPPEVVIRPPVSEGRPTGGDGPDPRPLVLSPTIAPPLAPEVDDGPRRNPLLPPGPGQAGPPRSRPSGVEVDRGDRRPPAAPPRQDRGRSGLFGGLLDRLAGRPSSPVATPRAGRPAGEGPGIDPDSPATIDAMRRDLERQIVARQGERLSSFEVLVVGRRVHIRAEAARPLQRRALRRGLEELPMPPGFTATVDVR